jgi:hypothetical protein
MKPGDRVKLVRCSDPHTAIRPGELGTVTFVDALGTVHVSWDIGATLGMIRGVDAIAKAD